MTQLSLVLIGAPGSGKGTQAKLLSAHYQIAHISSGDMLRERIKMKTPSGLAAKSYVDSGNLVPDRLMISLILERLRELDTQRGFVLDGFPRTLLQTEALDDALVQDDRQEIQAVFLLDVDEEELVRRLGGRGRHDDAEDKIHVRLRKYREDTVGAIKFYRNVGLLYEIDGTGTIDGIHAEIRDLITAII